MHKNTELLIYKSYICDVAETVSIDPIVAIETSGRT